MAGLAEAAARTAQSADDPPCALCGRPLGHRVERHHVVPKSEGGTQTVPVHPICHRTIHAFVANRDLATSYATMDQLRAREDIARYLRWIVDKPPTSAPPRASAALPERTLVV
ncbi:HNH endonuclease [Sphingomonas aerolata]|uniref:HNH endonuclease signature motif containing protein n=1 Tax=Sphingomonas aerolata TaxID=185951 RepID=UPI002FE1EA7B